MAMNNLNSGVGASLAKVSDEVKPRSLATASQNNSNRQGLPIRRLGFGGIARKLSIGPVSVLLVFTLLALPETARGLSSGHVLLMFFVAIAGIALHLAANMERNWLRIDTVFILAFFVVHFQWPLMYAITDLTPLYRYQYQSIERTGDFAVSLATIAILSWVIGYALVQDFGGKKRVDRLRDPKVLIVLFAVLTMAFSFFAGEAFFNRTIYTTFTQGLTQTIGGVAAYLYSLLEIFALMALSYLMYSRIAARNLNQTPFANRRISGAAETALVALLLLYSLIFLVAGDRGQVALLLVGLSLTYAANIRAVRLWEFLALAVTGFLIFSFIGIWRAGDSAVGASAIGDFGYWQISTNLAQSIVSLTQAIILFDRDGPYFGALWLSQIMGLVPFAQSLFIEYTGTSILQISSAALLTDFTFGSNLTSGLGTSFVADIYLNVGVWGLAIISCAYGAICKRMSTWLRFEYGFTRFFCAVAFGSLVIYIARSSVIFQLKPILWGLLLCWLVIGAQKVSFSSGRDSSET